MVNPTLVDVLAWFHEQLDRALPENVDNDTPCDYYRDGHGWDAAPIDAKLLGYAPANSKDELIAASVRSGARP